MNIVTLLLAAALCLVGAPTASAQEKKILIAYFSHTQTTEKVAHEIQARVGGDLFKIKTVQPYPAEHRATVDYAEKERDANARPALKGSVQDSASYDVIFLGYPIWWYTLPMPVMTFLESYNLAGKTIIPFCTHGGSRMSGTEDEIKKLQPNATVLDGLAVSRGILQADPTNGAQRPVAEWLSTLKY